MVVLRFLSLAWFGSALCAAASSVVLCGQYDEYTSSSFPYTFSTDEWGDDHSGSQCIIISNNDTVFNATWNWSDNPNLVHAFPNIRLESDLLPIQLSNLSALNIAVSWSMTASADAGEDLAAINATADVVVDMFLDPNPVRANSTTLPQYEVMVWMAAFGGKTPIGFNSSIESPPTYSLGGTEFKLYSSPNGNGQLVYSWLASSNISSFSDDISPLLEYLWRHNLISDLNYLGTVQFGSEAFHASSNVTFSAWDFNLSIESGKPVPMSQGNGHVVPNLAFMLLFPFSAWLLSLILSIPKIRVSTARMNT